MRLLKGITTALAVAGLCVASTSAFGALDQTVIGSGLAADGNFVSASVRFEEISGTQLRITLQNTSPTATPSVATTLYGVYFNGVTVQSLVSGIAPAGSTIWNGSVNPATSAPVGAGGADIMTDGWGYRNAGWGITGLSAMGAGNPDFGLLSPGFSGNFSDGLPAGPHNPYVQNSGVFVLNYSGTLGPITDVSFLFGTAGYTVVPEPTTMLAGGLLLLPFAASTIRMVRKNRKA